MKINSKILSLPPYISTTWSNIKTIYLKNDLLVISLCDGPSISIPGLSESILQSIFEAHMSYLENEIKPEQPHQKNPSTFNPFEGNEPSIKMGIGFLENMGSALQHNPDQKNAPDLPKQVLDKITMISKIIAQDEVQNLPKPEPHCNCPHCQIARAFIGEEYHHKIEENFVIDEEIKDEDLFFQEWEIKQTGDNLFNVINKLDRNEHYNVFLGNPVGCTCGKTGCEHILAVLKS